MSAYQIYEFDGVALPTYNQDQDLGTGAVDPQLLASVGGVFDVAPGSQRLPRMTKIAVAGLYAAVDSATYNLVDHAGNRIVDHAGNAIIATTDQKVLRYQVDQLRAKIGVQAKLWRRRWDNQTVRQWKTARLLNAGERNDIKHRTRMAIYECQFETAMAAWRDATSDATSAAFTASQVAALLFASDGNATIEDTIISVAASGTITSLQFAIPNLGIDLRYTGTLNSGQTLRIDCGAQTVKIGTAAAYAGFALGSGHTARTWLPLPPGRALMLVTANGPGTVTGTHYDQWI